MRRLLILATHPAVIAILFAVYGFMVVVVMNNTAEHFRQFAGTMEPLDLLLSYTPEQVNALFEVLGEEGRRTYLTIETGADIAYPLSYGLLLSLGTIYFIKKSFPRFIQLQYLGIFGIISMIMDFIENFLIVQLIQQYPSIQEGSVATASAFTSLKWGFAIIALLLLVGAMLIYLSKKYVFRKI